MHSHGLSIQCGLYIYIYTFFFYNVHQSQGKSSVVNKRFSFPEIQCVYQIIKLLIVHANQILKKKKRGMEQVRDGCHSLTQFRGIYAC